MSGVSYDIGWRENKDTVSLIGITAKGRAFMSRWGRPHRYHSIEYMQMLEYANRAGLTVGPLDTQASREVQP